MCVGCYHVCMDCVSQCLSPCEQHNYALPDTHTPTCVHSATSTQSSGTIVSGHTAVLTPAVHFGLTTPHGTDGATLQDTHRPELSVPGMHRAWGYRISGRNEIGGLLTVAATLEVSSRDEGAALRDYGVAVGDHGARLGKIHVRLVGGDQAGVSGDLNVGAAVKLLLVAAAQTRPAVSTDTVAVTCREQGESHLSLAFSFTWPRTDARKTGAERQKERREGEER